MTPLATVNGVAYYNGADAVTPQAAAALIMSHAAPKFLVIAPYEAKVADQARLAQTIEDHGVVHVFLLGSDFYGFDAALKAVGFAHLTLRPDPGAARRAVADCQAIAEAGDSVILLAGKHQGKPYLAEFEAAVAACKGYGVTT